jgi:hypothetical protein
MTTDMELPSTTYSDSVGEDGGGEPILIFIVDIELQIANRNTRSA